MRSDFNHDNGIRRRQLQLSAPADDRDYIDVSPADPEATIPTIGELVRGVLRRKWLIVLGGLLGAIASVAFIVFRPVVYSAVTTLEVQGINENFMNFNTVDPFAGSGANSANALNIQTQIRILQSQRLRDRAVERLRLEAMPTPPAATGYLQSLRLKLGIIPANPVEGVREALNMAVKNARAGAVRDTRIIEIRTESTIPEVAALFLNTMVSEYADQMLEVRSSAALRTSEWFMNQMQEARARMEAAEAKLIEFQRKTGYTAVAPTDTLAGARALQLRAELAASGAERIRKQADWEQIQRVPPENLGQAVQDALLMQKETAIVDLKRQVAELRTKFRDGFGPLPAKIAELKEAEEQAAIHRAGTLNRIKGAYEAAVQQERHLQNEYARQTRVVASESGPAADRELLQREADIARQAYNALLTTSNQASMAAALPASQVRTIDPAVADSDPQGFGLVPGVLMGLVAGSLMGIAFVVAREFMNRTVRTPSSTAKLLNVPQLGIIPSRDLVMESSGRLKKRPNKLRAMLQGSVNSPAAEGWKETSSFFVDSFRLAVSSLMITRDRAATSPVLLITSPGPREGKTTITSSLGRAIAETGLRAVLVDMDLRRPSLHKAFSLQATPGLAELVTGREPITREKVLALLRPTDSPGLSVIPMTALDPDQIQVLLYHPRLVQLLAVLRQEFDFVLIDSCPMGAYSDARALGRIADGVLMVLRAGVTVRDGALEVRRQLEADGTPLLGTILNDIKPEEHTAYYRSYYTTVDDGRN